MSLRLSQRQGLVENLGEFQLPCFCRVFLTSYNEGLEKGMSLELPFRPGDLVDAQLMPEECYCPAIFNSVTNGKVHINWIGWPLNNNDVIDNPEYLLRPNWERVRYVKAWVRLTKPDHIPWWPCIVYIRQPLMDSDIGIDFLQTEKRILIKVVYEEPRVSQLKPYTSTVDGTVWFDAKNIIPYCGKYTETRIAEGLSHKNEKIALAFKDAVARINSPDFRLHGTAAVVDYPFVFDGTMDTGKGVKYQPKVKGERDDDGNADGDRGGKVRGEGKSRKRNSDGDEGLDRLVGVKARVGTENEPVPPMDVTLPDDLLVVPGIGSAANINNRSIIAGCRPFDASLTVPSWARGGRLEDELADKYELSNLLNHAQLDDLLPFGFSGLFSNKDRLVLSEQPNEIVEEALKAQGHKRKPREIRRAFVNNT